MVNCAVFGCNSRSARRAGDQNAAPVKFFSIPNVIKRQCPRTEELSARRRAEWFRRINRRDMDYAGTYYKVCEKHFISGRPAYVMAETDPDWAPSLHLGYKTSSQESRAARYRRRLNRAMGAVRHTSNHQVEVHLVTSNMDDDAEPPVPYLVEGITTEERNEKQGDAPVFFLADN
uniref:THAP-type domain-containing protein n=1 Tax=Rhipicephalus appendiculatus TaxID=34631 RepID=A0A131YP19_RHIAP